MLQGSDIAVEPKAGNDADAGVRGHGVLADFFAFVDIADVDLDHGKVAASECVAQGEAGMGECTGVDDQAEHFIIGELADLINDEAFVVRLIELHFHAKVGRCFSEQVLKVG